MKLGTVGFALFLILCSFAASAHAACSAATIQGAFAAQFTGVYVFDGYSSTGLGRVEFDGLNKIKLYGAREGAGGQLSSYTGGGKYKLGSTCQGTANLSLYSDGVITDELLLDLVVSGTIDNPTVMVLISNVSRGYTGQGVLQKIAL
jgi:hypothetical protein